MLRQRIQSRPYFLWVLYLPCYLLLFQLAEHLIITDYWVSYCPLDDKIPFLPPFVVAYVLWYPLMLGTGLYLLIRDPRAFVRYMYSTSIGLTASLVICLIFPNGQNLRPELADDDLFCWVLGNIYAVDTNTNVLPSMHVVGTMSALFAWFDTTTLRSRWVRPALVILGILINASTVFVKQHSFLDITAGLVLALSIWFLVYRVLPQPRIPAAETDGQQRGK